ncbi:MAG: leucine-rich repeat domain-containing protein [Limisphaerales bacterium]
MKNRIGPCAFFFVAAVASFFLIQTALGQLTITTNNGAITITGVSGSPISITIPAKTNGYPVTTIANSAFGGDSGLSGIIIPDSVTNIGNLAFASSGLTNVTIPGSVIGIGYEAFVSCESLTNVSVDAGNPAYSSLNGVLFDKDRDTLIQYPPALPVSTYTVPSTVNSITNYAFYGALSLGSVTIPRTLVHIGDDAFTYCVSLNTLYFNGNAPSVGADAFFEADNGVAVYDLPGTTGWASFYAALGASFASSNLWYQASPLILNFEPSFGLHNGQFGFAISWATNAAIVVEANGNPSDPVWVPISTNTVAATNGTANFSDPQWRSYPKRFYRLEPR